MMKITTGQIELVAPRERLDYFDQRSVELPAAVTPIEAWRVIMADPLPLLGLAFRLRDAISARFGVKRIGGFSGEVRGFVQEGDRLDFFLVETATDNVLSLSARDRHLDVLTCITSVERTLTITSSVKVHNLFGRAYMVVVGPAHKLIVSAMLRRLRRGLR
ncbi:DUF2867 domain-containing protein [uncultured Sulfitobacter sp.]|uniref:DUF2867 domain-containing protein n=1 Tax=uncultured Sulfitobacter sp. TaxID=191468 RepID=UPI002620D851|nr:DUF2867 domain-containing protein [uncultured Sulfitobacter sp.]